MSKIINTTTDRGIYEASTFEFTPVTEKEFSADVSGASEPITLIVDTTSDKSNEYSLTLISLNGKKKSIPLAVGSLNVTRLTTYGYKKDDGYMDFEISGNASLASAGIKVAVLKYTPVVNN